VARAAAEFPLERRSIDISTWRLIAQKCPVERSETLWRLDGRFRLSRR
jgi:hypothetical protein